MTVVDDETSRLWQLLTELSAQLSANKEHCESLKRQCEQLKTQAIHTGTGFTLRRFNTDITKEQFESELERFNATLVLENQALQYENRQLSMLLKDYEGTLDNVMAKFRSFAYSSQQFDLDSAKHYETLLLQYGASAAGLPLAGTTASAAAAGRNLGGPPTTAPILSGNDTSLSPQSAIAPLPPALNTTDPLALQWSLAHLSSLLRKALRSLQGEEDISSEDSSDSADYASDASDDGIIDSGSGNGQQGRQNIVAASSSSSSRGREHKLQSLVNRATSVVSHDSSDKRRRTTSPGSHPDPSAKHDESEGGYIRLLLNSGFDKSTAALERDIELERLRQENEALREMLGVATEPPTSSTSQLQEQQRSSLSTAAGFSEGRRV